MSCGALGLGVLLARERWIEDGVVHVWVPDGVDSVQPENLRFDRFNDPDTPTFGLTQVKPEAFRLFDQCLEANPDSLLVTDTFYLHNVSTGTAQSALAGIRKRTNSIKDTNSDHFRSRMVAPSFASLSRFLLRAHQALRPKRRTFLAAGFNRKKGGPP